MSQDPDVGYVGFKPPVAPAAHKASLHSRFHRDGFVGPVPLFTAAQCALICRYLGNRNHPAPLDWGKGRAATDRFVYDLAVRPQLLVLLKQLIGDDIILWGASAVTRNPGQVHPWHTDIESSAQEGGFVSVWIGLRNTSRESALQLIRGSSNFGKTIQQVVHEHSLRRGEASAAMVLEWAREIEPEAEIVQPEMKDGEAILFDGRLWHGSDNTRREGRRVALILQYAVAHRPVHNYEGTEWPFRFKAEPRPPVVTVSGVVPGDVNRLVPPPANPGSDVVRTHIESPALPFTEDAEKRWKPYPIFRGPTPTLHEMGCHVSVLSAGHSPHPPHSHLEEELLIVLDGEGLIVVGESADASKAKTARMSRGMFVYYRAYQHHTICNPGTQPVTYLMFKWRAAAAETVQPLGSCIFEFGNAALRAPAKPFATQLVFQGPTSFLGKLHCHLTDLQPRAGYAPHSDPYDVAIVVVSGTVETLGRMVGPNGVIYCSAGELHGMRNVGDGTARYLVFEFHPPALRAGPRPGTLT